MLILRWIVSSIASGIDLPKLVHDIGGRALEVVHQDDDAMVARSGRRYGLSHETWTGPSGVDSDTDWTELDDWTGLGCHCIGAAVERHASPISQPRTWQA